MGLYDIYLNCSSSILLGCNVKNYIEQHFKLREKKDVLKGKITKLLNGLRSTKMFEGVKNHYR